MPLDIFLNGLKLTLLVTGLAFSGALVLGALLAGMRISPIAPLRAVSALYVEVGRNVPLLALLFLTVYGLPQIDIRISLFWSAVLVLICYEAVYASEALRSGVNAVDPGTAMAARALGFTNLETFWSIILPQAARNVVQPLTNVFIKTTLNSSIIAIIGLVDVTGAAERINIASPQPLLFVAAGLVYVTISLLAGQGAARIERIVDRARA